MSYQHNTRNATTVPTINEAAWTQIVNFAASKLKPDDATDPQAEMLRDLRTIGRFKQLSADDQEIVYALGNTALGGGNSVSTIVQYWRTVLAAADLMTPGEYIVLRNVFVSATTFQDLGFFSTKDALHDRRLAAVTKLMECAIGRGLIEFDPLEGYEKYRNPKSQPKPASNHDVFDAVDRQIEKINCSTGFYRVCEIRNLLMLAVKSYGLRSIEMEWQEIGDIDLDTGLMRVRVSKTQLGIRTHILNAATVHLFRMYLMERTAYAVSKGRPAPGPNDPMWLGQRNNRMKAKNISAAISKLLPEDVRPHQLRTRMGTAIAKVLGRVDVGTALGITPGATDAYVGADEPFGVMSKVAEEAVHPPTDRITVLVHPAAVDRRHRSTSSDCWLPDEYLAGLEADERAAFAKASLAS